MNDLDHMHHYLGIKVWREDGKTLIIHIQYIMELIKRFNMIGCNPMPTSL